MSPVGRGSSAEAEELPVVVVSEAGLWCPEHDHIPGGEGSGRESAPVSHEYRDGATTPTAAPKPAAMLRKWQQKQAPIVVDMVRAGWSLVQEGHVSLPKVLNSSICSSNGPSMSNSACSALDSGSGRSAKFEAPPDTAETGSPCLLMPLSRRGCGKGFEDSFGFDFESASSWVCGPAAQWKPSWRCVVVGARR